MKAHQKVASLWIRRLIQAAYSPEFYREMGVRQNFRHPETGRMVVFQSLPSEVQKKYHDEWKARKQFPQSRMRRKDFTKIRDRARDLERGFDPDEEAATAKSDRLEMAKAIKEMKNQGVPARILKKERKRLLQEMESRRLKRKKEREEAFAQSQQGAA